MAASRYFDYGNGRLNYLTHISRRHGAVFVEVPKAGCSVVKRAMQHSEHGTEPFVAPKSVHERSTSPLGAPLRDGFDLDEVFGPDSPYVRFSFVRNPYSRALSCYLEKIVGEQWLRDMRLPKLGFDPHEEVSFVQFLQRVSQQEPRDMDIHWAPQHHLLALDKVQYAFLGRFESFHRDLTLVVERLGMTVPADLLSTTTSHTTNASSKVTRFFGREALDLVQSIYADDFASLGYGRDPRFVG